MSISNDDPYLLRPHVCAAWDKLYWGLLGYSDGYPGELADMTAVEIYNYVAADLSTTLNRPAPLDEIAAVIVEVWQGVQNAYYAASLTVGQSAADETCVPIILLLEEAWLLVETEAGVSMPPEYRFFKFHLPISVS